MKRNIVMALTLIGIFGVVGYAGGLFTREVLSEESCPYCRAIRYTGRHYGFGFGKIEDGQFTNWYRQNIDADHGLDIGHPHVWYKSGCTLKPKPQSMVVDEDCTWIPTVFLIRPEIELAALQQIPDRETRLALIKSLNTDKREDNTKRVRLLVEYYFVARDRTPWSDWWKRNSYEFGIGDPPPAPPASPKQAKGGTGPEIPVALRSR
jgi:hypothetical protein